MLPHMLKEEQILFPYVTDMEQAIKGKRTAPTPFFGTVKNPVRKMMAEHDRVGELLATLRTVTSDYALPEDACFSYRELYRRLAEFELRTHEHIHIENNLYFPRAVALEDQAGQPAAFGDSLQLELQPLMSAELHAFLARDHERLDALLEELSRGEGGIPRDRYDEFRRGLLRHIGIEERVLFPELRKRRGAASLEQQLHRDHAALAALLVPPPTHAEIEQIAEILTTHNQLEEEPGGLYEIIEELAAGELQSLMERVHAIPAIPSRAVHRLAPAAENHRAALTRSDEGSSRRVLMFRAPMPSCGRSRAPLISAETEQAVLPLHPIGRLGESEEVVSLVAYLGSGEASFVTGAGFLVDGGYTAA